MISIYLPDVGDGLTAGIRTISNQNIQIDCGSQQYPRIAFEKGLSRIDPDIFILSHFHTDHYNGLFQAPPRKSLFFRFPTIKQVFFPRMPEFKQKKKLMKCLLAMNKRVLGDTTGSMVVDLLGIISKINFGPFTYQALSLGDTVRIGSSQFEILWPPRTIKEKETLKVIRDAISAFEDAAEEDECLHQILERIAEESEIKPYFSEDDEVREIWKNGEDSINREKPVLNKEKQQLLKSVRKANSLLHHAANRLSLAFHQDNRLLFMGDLEEAEIKKVVQHLTKENRKHFIIMITPHHGTHWHKGLKNLHSWWALSSVGERLFHNIKAEFKSTCYNSLITYLNGDIEIPLHFTPWYGLRPCSNCTLFI